MRNPFRYFNSSPEVIRLAVMMYIRYPLSLRQTEDLLFERSIDICHETVRFWWNRFGPMFAAEIRKRRVHHTSHSRWRWHLDEVFIRINGETHYLWRAVDHEGEVLEVFATKRRDRNATLNFLKRTMKRYGRPRSIVGEGCAKLLDEQMRDLLCERIQVDEIWSYVGKKQARLTREDDRSRFGDMWTFVALDPDTKLVPAYRVGKRTKRHAVAFMTDLSERLENRVQISSDALISYVDAVEQAFGADVDYGQTVKFYEAEPIGPGRYSPPRVVKQERSVMSGRPDQRHISTSLVERQNLTMRMSMRRFTRLTNAFSKKLENLEAAVSLHFAHYNFVRMHKSLRMTPAMAGGVSNRLWSLEELVDRTSN